MPVSDPKPPPQALSHGTIVVQTPCAPNPVRTYTQYVEAAKRGQAAEVEAAQREGFRMEMPADSTPGLLSREEFERRRMYAGFECHRITYLSDGLMVVGILWKPQDTAGKRRPALANVSRALSPGFEQRGEALLRERSAVYWAEQINVPVLILHGGADWRAEPMRQAQAFATSLRSSPNSA